MDRRALQTGTNRFCRRSFLPFLPETQLGPFYFLCFKFRPNFQRLCCFLFSPFLTRRRRFHFSLQPQTAKLSGGKRFRAQRANLPDSMKCSPDKGEAASFTSALTSASGFPHSKIVTLNGIKVYQKQT